MHMVYSDLSAKRGLSQKNDSMQSRRLCFGLLALVRKQPVVMVVAVLVASLCGLQGTAQGQVTFETVIPDFGVTCTSTGQLCEPPFTVSFETSALLQVQYTVRADHCSSVRLHIFVDNVLVQTTDFLGWPGAGAPFDGLPLQTELLDLGPVSSGPHVLALQAEGQESGCNTGNLSSWGGSIRLLTTLPFTVVADSGLPVPGGSGVFTTFPQSPAVSTGSVAFLGLGSADEEGVYSCDIFSPVDPCRKIADLTAAIPQGTGTFTAFSDVTLALVPPNLIRVAFLGTGSGQAGVYSCDSAAPVDPCRKIADLTTAIPDGTGTFTGFMQLAAGDTLTSFIGTGGSGQAGVYSCDSATPVDPCRKIADLTTAIPDGTGTFTAFSDVTLALVPPNPVRVAFIGTGSSGQAGVYSCDSAQPVDPCQPIADLFTAIPGGTGNFTGFTSVSTSLEHTAFLGLGSGEQAGIYLASALTKVIAVGDLLDGKTVTALRLGRFGLDRLRLTFTATFADGSEGVFVAQVATYPFTGFFAPVDNLPVLNQAKAGSAIPVQFSLGSDQGLAIFATGSPKSEQIACDSTALVDGVEQTVTAGGSSLSYDPATDQYTYVWKTAKAWAQTCRQLVLMLQDNSVHRANFTFK
jgi:hypothetical protein